MQPGTRPRGAFNSAYDAENRLTTSNNGVVAAAYTYDGDGRRVQKVSGSTTTNYVYDAAGQLAAEYTSAAAQASPCGTCYLTADTLGSTRMITDETGTPRECHDYLPFGEEITRTAGCYGTQTSNTLKFTGKERDVETGNDWFLKRYLGSPQGRFTSPDPFIVFNLKKDQFQAWIGNPQRWNKYAYALNNPLAFIDPTGMNACGTNDDSTCKVTVEIRGREADKNGKYNDQFKDVKNQSKYNAIATAKVNGEVAGTFLAKTTPSDSNSSATAAAGTYNATLTTHSGQLAIRLQPTDNIPTVGPNPSRADGADMATGILVHQSGLANFTGVGRDGRAVSQGCQIIPRSQYGDFMDATGMTPDAGNPQRHFTVTVDTPLNRQQSDAVLPDVPSS